jgi:hypothetical protein
MRSRDRQSSPSKPKRRVETDADKIGGWFAANSTVKLRHGALINGEPAAREVAAACRASASSGDGQAAGHEAALRRHDDRAPHAWGGPRPVLVVPAVPPPAPGAKRTSARSQARRQGDSGDSEDPEPVETGFPLNFIDTTPALW